MKGVLTSTGTTSRSVAERFGFEFCASEEKDIFGNAEINTVFIATRHNTHAQYVIKALESGKNVFVEKPLCLSESELDQIVDAYKAEGRSKKSEVGKDKSEIKNQKAEVNSEFCIPNSALILMVGFNRRFSKLTELLKDKMPPGPMAMIYRVNAGAIPASSWIQDKEIGGGRIIGEVCHFIDYFTFINGSLPVSVFVSSVDDPQHLNDTVNVNLEFANGSIGSISYFSSGSKSVPKEYIEIYRNGVTAIMRDFKELEIFADKKTFHKKLISQDKGQKTMVNVFLDSIREGKPSPISFEDIHTVTLTTLKILESIQTRQKVEVRSQK